MFIAAALVATAAAQLPSFPGALTPEQWCVVSADNSTITPWTLYRSDAGVLYTGLPNVATTDYASAADVAAMATGAGGNLSLGSNFAMNFNDVGFIYTRWSAVAVSVGVISQGSVTLQPADWNFSSTVVVIQNGSTTSDIKPSVYGLTSYIG